MMTVSTSMCPQGEPHALIAHLYDPEYSHHDVDRAIALVPKLVELVHRAVNVALEARSNHGLDDNGVGLVADFEYVVPRYESEPGPGRLQVVDGLTHITFRGEDESL